MNKTDVILSTSAVLAALGALTDISEQKPKEVLYIKNSETPHEDAISAALANSAVESKIRRSLKILWSVQIDKDSLEDAWIRLASNTLIHGQTYEGGAQSQGVGAGRLDGHHADSTVEDPLGTSGLTACYSNCHSACHGSRGWR